MKAHFFILLCLILASAAYAQNYQLNPAKSTMAWAGKAAFSSYTLSGAIQPRAGTLVRNQERITEASLSIDMQSIRSDIAQLEQHLHSADFFEVQRFPEAVFVLQRPVSLGGGEAMAIGSLTIKGITREEEIPLSVRPEGKALVLEGRALLDRTAYGIYYNSPNFFEGLKQEAIADTFELSFRLVFEPAEGE